jgi:hypothetical protein
VQGLQGSVRYGRFAVCACSGPGQLHR